MSKETTYEVVERNRFLFFVDRVSYESPIAGETVEHRDTLRWFTSQDRAEACAEGLARGTWSADGPIRAIFEETDDDETDLTNYPDA